MLTGGLLPFPRTGCVLYAKAILSYCAEVRQVRVLLTGWVLIVNLKTGQPLGLEGVNREEVHVVH